MIKEPIFANLPTWFSVLLMKGQLDYCGESIAREPEICLIYENFPLLRHGNAWKEVELSICISCDKAVYRLDLFNHAFHYLDPRSVFISDTLKTEPLKYISVNASYADFCQELDRLCSIAEEQWGFTKASSLIDFRRQKK